MGKYWGFLYVLVTSVMLYDVNILLFTDEEFSGYD